MATDVYMQCCTSLLGATRGTTALTFTRNLEYLQYVRGCEWDGGARIGAHSSPSLIPPSPPTPSPHPGRTRVSANVPHLPAIEPLPSLTFPRSLSLVLALLPNLSPGPLSLSLLPNSPTADLHVSRPTNKPLEARGMELQ